jgi:hypothetical protein
VSLTMSKDEAQAQAMASWDRARAAAAQASAQAAPLVKNASAVALQRAQCARDWAAPRVAAGIYQARGWAAPRIDQAGQTVEGTVAPKVSEVLAATAQRVDPSPPVPERRIWPRVIATVVVLAAAGGAVAVILRGRRANPADALMADEETIPAASEPDTATAEERVMADGDVAGNANRASG